MLFRVICQRTGAPIYPITVSMSTGLIYIQQIDSRNEFPSLEYMKMDKNFVQIRQVFFEILQIIFLPLVGSSLLIKYKNTNYSGPNHSNLSIFFN